MTRARFRAYGVHRVFDKLLGGPLRDLRRVEELESSTRFSYDGAGEPSFRGISKISMEIEEEIPSKYYYYYYYYMKNTLFPDLVSIPTHSHESHPLVAGRTRVQYQTRKNSLISSHRRALRYTPRLRNEFTILYAGTRDLISVASKRYPDLSLFSSLSLSLSLSLFLHARACMLDETTSYFSLIFMLIGEFPYLPVIT
ncbi:hypothetical protein P5V15_010761 [Pogonomyrmex californicus]